MRNFDILRHKVEEIPIVPRPRRDENSWFMDRRRWVDQIFSICKELIAESEYLATERCTNQIYATNILVSYQDMDT